MLAALKFFLGQDEREDEDSDDDEEPAPAAPSREDMYKAKHKVCSSKAQALNVVVVARCRRSIAPVRTIRGDP